MARLKDNPGCQVFDIGFYQFPLSCPNLSRIEFDIVLFEVGCGFYRIVSFQDGSWNSGSYKINDIHSIKTKFEVSESLGDLIGLDNISYYRYLYENHRLPEVSELENKILGRIQEKFKYIQVNPFEYLLRTGPRVQYVDLKHQRRLGFWELDLYKQIRLYESFNNSSH